MDNIDLKDIIEISKVALPVITTLVTYLYTKRASARHSAKQSILQMLWRTSLTGSYLGSSL